MLFFSFFLPFCIQYGFGARIKEDDYDDMTRQLIIFAPFKTEKQLEYLAKYFFSMV
jgi:hypothetical protein